MESQVSTVVGSGIGILFYTTVASGLAYIALRGSIKPMRGLTLVASNVLGTLAVVGLASGLVGTAAALFVAAIRNDHNGAFLIPLFFAIALVGLTICAVRKIWTTA
jgi:hypothetical protein